MSGEPVFNTSPKAEPEAEPIRLKKTRLIRFGFKLWTVRKTGTLLNVYTISIGGDWSLFIYYSKGESELGIGIGSDNSRINITRKIKYIHELQNLYFDLSSKELTETSI